MANSELRLSATEHSTARTARSTSRLRSAQFLASALLATCVACGSADKASVATAGAPSTAGGGGSDDVGGTGAFAGAGAGANNNTAGSGGTKVGSGGAPVVGACDQLPEPGKWESIAPKASETLQMSGVINSQGLALDPFHVGTLWMGASVSGNGAGGLYKSKDCGATWIHVNTGMNGSKLDNGSMWSLAIDPVDEGTLYVVPTHGPGNLWKSTDGGVSFASVLPEGGDFAKSFAGNSVASVTMDPTDHLHLVVAPHGNCEGDYAPICNGESTDGGATWHLVKVPGEGWGEATGPFLLDGTSWLSSTNGLWLTKDNGANWKNVKPTNINYITGGEFTHRPFRKSALGNYYLATQQENGLITSTDGETWTYIKGTPNAQYQVGFAFGGGRLYLADVVGGGVQVADEAKPDTWTALPTLSAEYNGGIKGPIYLEYDEQHHVLYSSNFEGGIWRIVTP